MNVTYLYPKKGDSPCPPEEELYLLLDAETSPSEETRNITQHVQSCPDCQEKWAKIQDMLQPASSFSSIEPDPLIRTQVLEAAYADVSNSHASQNSTKTLSSFSWQVPGWRWAWAALFLILSWAGYIQMNPDTTTLPAVEQIDNELLTLEEEIQLLRFDLGLDSAYDSEDSTT